MNPLTLPVVAFLPISSTQIFGLLTLPVKIFQILLSWDIVLVSPRFFYGKNRVVTGFLGLWHKFVHRFSVWV
jgi:hypothetical protein